MQTSSKSGGADAAGVRSGLEGVLAAETRLSRVEGDVGRLTIAGYAVEVLAPAVGFETVAYLLLHDLRSSVAGGLGALKGPLHGGAPGPALAALLALRAEGGDLGENTRRWVEAELAAGRRILGFGHRVFRVRDPRANVLREAAKSLLENSDLLASAETHEAAVLETLRRLKPGRAIATNVEFYTALLLHGLGFEPAMFTSIFALGRVAGWIAHVAEQTARGRLIRPEALYVGAEGRELPAALRS